jgi:hypothetical protein
MPKDNPFGYNKATKETKTKVKDKKPKKSGKKK